MSRKPEYPRSRSHGFLLGLAAALLLLGIGGTVALLLVAPHRPAAIERSFSTYVKSLATAGKLVLVEARERLFIRETTPGQLFGDGALGNLLGIRSDATVEISAWADLSFAIDLNATEGWAVRFVPKDGGRLELALPPLGMLTPAVLTDTIEAKVADRSIFLDEARLVESARQGLTARFVEAAAAMAGDPGLRAKATEAMVKLARAFADEAGIQIATVGVTFAPAED